jgi:hypothetical protein
VNAPTEYENVDIKESFYLEAERVFHQFEKYHTESLLRDFNVKVGREDIFKPTREE